MNGATLLYWELVTSSVPQGSVFDPLLSVEYI